MPSDLLLQQREQLGNEIIPALSHFPAAVVARRDLTFDFEPSWSVSQPDSRAARIRGPRRTRQAASAAGARRE
jgi:hypothetical protein